MKKILILILILITSNVYADTVNQDNVSGSNSNIESMTSSTTYQSGSSSSNSTTNSSTSNIKSAPMSSSAPGLGSMNNCALALSAGVQNFSIGISAGRHIIDKNCELINLSKALNAYGMKVAAISLLCTDERVWKAMFFSKTYCPVEGSIGKDAYNLIVNKYDYKMPNYEKYVQLEKAKKNKITIKKLKTNFSNEDMD